MREINENWGLSEAIGCLRVIADSIMGEPKNNRTNALTYEKKDLFIDTCYCYDTDFWETAIGDKRYDDDLIIVEEYSDKEEAIAGHKKWVKKMTSKTPPENLRSIQNDDIYKLLEATND